MIKNQSQVFVIGFIGLALSIAIGAFGAHSLKDLLNQNKQLATFETASTYFRLGATSIILMGIIMQWQASKWLKAGLNCIVIGTIIFSGTLYILAITNTKWLGAITPIGGVLLIGGHLCIAYHFMQNKNASKF